jgi:hypothetical protein
MLFCFDVIFIQCKVVKGGGLIVSMHSDLKSRIFCVVFMSLLTPVTSRTSISRYKQVWLFNFSAFQMSVIKILTLLFFRKSVPLRTLPLFVFHLNGKFNT